MEKTSKKNYSQQRKRVAFYCMTPMIWGYVLLVVVGALALFYDPLIMMASAWSRDEYSHGYLLPFVVGGLIWQNRINLKYLNYSDSWIGLLVVIVGLAGFVLGEYGTLYIVEQYSFLLFVFGLTLSLIGWERFKLIAAPLFILLFAIPLPSFLYNNLSQSLQLVSSEIGVAVIRVFGITVFLEGNVIDLGEFKLQVVEACSGLRYLFPLMALGFIAAYLFKGSFWKRVLIFLSTIPITVLMNSFRIGMIGVLVEHWGQSMAEGFLHDFEGWIIFMACAAILMLEMALLARIGKNKLSLSEAFGLEAPAPIPEGAEKCVRPIPKPFIASVVILSFALVGSLLMEDREEFMPEAKSFAGFPMEIGPWNGKADTLEQIYVDALKFDDYMIADYVDQRNQPVNLYVAYYGSQRKGASVHSPRSCIPGGGWKIQSLSQREIAGVSMSGKPLMVNRTVIQLGEYKQLVYYWFQQRGRVMTNEYLVKWYLFWDAVTKNRTDGSLVRLTTSVMPGQDVEEADRLLADFARQISPELERFIPD